MKQLIIDLQAPLTVGLVLFVMWCFVIWADRKRKRELKEYENRYPRPGKVVKHWRDNIVK